MTDKEAMKLALEALENQIANVYDTESNAYKKCAPAITAIKEALAQPPQRTWVWLTDDEVKHEWKVWRASLPRYIGFAQGLEAKLKEKNFDTN